MYNRMFTDFAEDVENYELAKSDNFKGWELHHKLEALFSQEEMIRMNIYFFRPARELIFLKRTKGNGILSHYYWPHKKRYENAIAWGKAAKGRPSKLKGRKLSEETRRKMSEAQKGHKPTFVGHHTDDAKARISEASSKRRLSDDAKLRISMKNKAHWAEKKRKNNAV